MNRGLDSERTWSAGRNVGKRDDRHEVFNPIRPMDNGVQAGSGGDGLGNACDRCLLDAGNVAAAFDPYNPERMVTTDGE